MRAGGDVSGESADGKDEDWTKECVRETLNPNLSGNSEKRRWRRVLFPTPEGPDMTRGRLKSALIVENGVLNDGVLCDSVLCDVGGRRRRHLVKDMVSWARRPVFHIWALLRRIFGRNMPREQISAV